MVPRLVLAASVAAASCAALAWGLGACGNGGKGTSDASTGDDTGDDVVTAMDASPDRGDEPPPLMGGCQNLDGACDLVLQDCDAGKQCVAVTPFSGNSYTACTPTNSHQHIDKGYPCCATGNVDECLPGLQCVGANCGDAGLEGPGTGRCTPACCPGNDPACGQSPEGFNGTCSLQVVDRNGSHLYYVCLYVQPCKPFGLTTCPKGYGCYLLPNDNTGAAQCVQTYDNGNPPGQEGQPCPSVNACQPGLDCLGVLDGGKGSVCTMVCYTGKGNPPFDPKLLDGGPGAGGCDMGKTCVGVGNYPAWLGLCE